MSTSKRKGVGESSGSKKKRKEKDSREQDACVPLWDKVRKEKLDQSRCPTMSGLDAFLSNNPSCEVYTNQDSSVVARPSKRVQAVPKLKTPTDIAYDIMSSNMSASLGNSKAKVYDYWIDMGAAEKQKYIGQAREVLRAMSPAELKGVQLTAEEIAELGIVIAKESSPPPAPPAATVAKAALGSLSSGVDDDACVKYREREEDDEESQEARRNARNSRGRLMQSKPSIASLQSFSSSFVEDDEALADDASDNYADMDIVNDESARTPLNLNFLMKRRNVDGTEKLVPPSLGLQYQAALEPWVPVQDRAGEYAHLGDRDRVERAAAGVGRTWTATKEDKAEITSAFLKEALIVIKNAMYNKLIEIAHKRQKQMTSAKTQTSRKDALSPVVDGHTMVLRADCTESLLQLLYDCKFQADTALDSLRHQCQQSDAAFFSTWSHVEQERAYTAFAKFGDDVGRIASAVPSKQREEVVDYFFKTLYAGRFLEAECRMDDCLRRAEQEALALNSSDAGSGSELYRARGMLHNFALPASLASSLPPNVLEATEAVAKESEDFARTFGQNNPLPAKPKVGRPSRDGVKKENAALDQLQKLKSIAFMIKARNLLDDVCFTFLFNSLTEYRRSTLSPAELVVRMRSICHFASDSPLLSRTDIPAPRSSSSKLQPSKDEALGDLFDTFLEFLPRPIELLCKT